LKLGTEEHGSCAVYATHSLMMVNICTKLFQNPSVSEQNIMVQTLKLSFVWCGRWSWFFKTSVHFIRRI